MTTALTTHRGFAPQTMTEAIQFSEMLAGSSMVPKAYQGKPQDILVCVQWGYEIGLAPMQALQNIAVINGKPSVYGDAALALVQASDVCESVEEMIENEGTANPVAVCIAKRFNRPPVISRFSVEDAKRAGLWGKQGPWQAYPKRMLQMRARGFALRDAFPDVLRGLITAEEAQDYPQQRERDITPPAPRNPLDRLVAPPAAPPVEREPVVQTSDPIVIAEEMSDVIEPDEARAEREAIQSESWPLMAPGKTEPMSVHQTLDDWLIAYNNLADRAASAGRAEPRTRMTKLRELRDANQDMIDRLNPVLASVVAAAYQRRLKVLGIQMQEAGQTAPEPEAT